MNITELENIHTPTDRQYFSEDGLRETWVEVCEHCEDNANLKYAAEYPCEVLQEAYDADLEASEDGKQTCFVLDTRPIIEVNAHPGAGSCLACLTPLELCSSPITHAFLHIPAAKEPTK